MPQLPHNAKDIFLAALDRAEPADRAIFVTQACSGDDTLRRHVEALLSAHDEPDRLLDQSRIEHDVPLAGSAGNAAIAQYLAEQPGTMIGPYKLLEVLGEGGMGVVYLADQSAPVERRVALKIIKPGMDSLQVIARFEAERQALAMMDHANIARVLDVGTTQSGHPYFVMELVQGVPITQYCDDNRLTPRQRLALFVPVCQAIQHAHQKGIIHRDIKPSNVMITLYDGRPVPKVIDFGVAKAIDQRLTERTLFTQHGTLVGTLEYMSPEQADPNGLGVDTRSDIFSLGVLLYELLTGGTPLCSARVRAAAYGEVLRLIKEEEPPRPSVRLSDSGEALASISARRQMEPAKLTKLVRGELDWIVMKTLEKDRNRRYETANAFAADVQRYLADEPVQACPPSALYRFQKFARRYQAALGVAGLLALALVLGTVASTWQAVRATLAESTARTAERATGAQRDRAIRAETVARTERDKALTEKSRADEEAAIATAVNDFLQNDLLAEAAPYKNARNKQVTLEEVLARAAARIPGKFDQQPLVEAAIRRTIGSTYYELGNFEAAQPHMERALELRRRVLGEGHAETLRSLHNLGVLFQTRGEYAKAEPLLVQTVDLRRRSLGEEHPDTLASMNSLASLYAAQGKPGLAEPLYQKTLEFRRRVLGAEHPDTLVTMNDLALQFQLQGQPAQAEPLYIKTLEVRRRVLGEEHPSTLTSLNNLGGLYQEQARFAAAEALYLQSLELSRRVLGEEHPDTLGVMNNLAGVYQAQSQLAKAEPLFRQTLVISRRVLGEEHPNTLKSLNNLGLLFQAKREFTRAEPIFLQTLEIRRRVLGPDHSDTLTSINNLAEVYHSQGKLPQAELMFVQALADRRRLQGDEHPHTLVAMNNLAGLYQSQRLFDKAEPLYVQTLALRRRILGPEHPHTLNSLQKLGGLYLDQGQLEKAEPLCVQTVELRRRVLGPAHRDTIGSINALAALYQSQQEPAKAEPHYREVLEQIRARPAEGLPPLAGALFGLAQNLLQQNRHAEAEPLLRECLQIRQSQLPESWTTFNVQSLLGGCLLGQRKYAAAEPVLLAGYAGLKQRAATIPTAGKFRLTESLERLVQLYEATGQSHEAAEWRQKLVQAKEPAEP